MISINIVLMMSSLFRVSGQLWYICIIEYNMCVYLPVFWCVWVCGEEGRGWEGVSIFFSRHIALGGEAGGGGPPPFFLATNKFIKLQIFSSFF